MSWKNRPVFIEHWPDDPDVEYVIFVDENGHSSLDYVKRQISNGCQIDTGHLHFSVTACCIKKSEFPKIRKSVMEIKNKHWENALYAYKNGTKRICFHSRDIRRREGPFSPDIIDRDLFLDDLTCALSALDYGIMSYCINKEALCRKYRYPANPYHLCMDFLFERSILNLIPAGKKCIVVLEARGKQQDKELLAMLVNSIEYGTQFVFPDRLQSIQGIYFNRKWCALANDQKSYFGLEIADLISYPIYKKFTSGVSDLAYESIAHKIIGYPHRINGFGMKYFP